MPYKVREVADMVGISVRTLHHYDQIDLLKPAYVSPAGYRFYTDAQLERLQQILFFKELEFNLQEIKDILDRQSFDRKSALETHKELLIEKKNRLERIIESVEKTIYSIEGGIEMDKKEMFDVFDMSKIEKHKEKYAHEVRKKYGNTSAYTESEEKTSKYTKNDWSEIMTKGDVIYKKIVDVMDKGAVDPQVQEAIGELRQHITDNFYTCTLEIFRGLGDLYVNDERFTENIDRYKPGLSKFLRKAMNIYCDNMEK